MADYSTPDELKERLARAMKAKAVLAERSKRLQEQVDDLRRREDVIANITTELLDRQRELNLMLHRANSFVHQLRDANLALSAEFKELVKELPAARDSSWDSMVNRVNELFEKTHELAGEMEDELFLNTASTKSRSSEQTRNADVGGQVFGEAQIAQPSESRDASDQSGPVAEASADDESPRAEVSADLTPEESPTPHEIRMDQILTNLQSDEEGRIDWKPPDGKSKSDKGSLFSRLFGRDDNRQ